MVLIAWGGHKHTQKSKACSCRLHSHAYPGYCAPNRYSSPSWCRANPPVDGISVLRRAVHVPKMTVWTPEVPPEPQSLKETCATWHLLPQLLPDPNTAGWSGASNVSKVSCSRKQQQQLSIELGISQSAVQCSNTS